MADKHFCNATIGLKINKKILAIIKDDPLTMVEMNARIPK